MNIPSDSHTRVLDALIQAQFTNHLAAWGASSSPRTRLHASALIVPTSEWCYREHYLRDRNPDEVGAAEPASPHLNAIFLNGWTLHRKWQFDLFKKHGCVVRRAHQYCLDLTHEHEELNMLYSPDAILEIFGERWPVEIKGINTEEYQDACNLPLLEAIKVSETIKKARVQVTLYMHLLGVGQGAILAEDKNTQQFKVWTLAYDQSIIQEYISRVEVLKKIQQDDTPPDRHKGCTSIKSARARRCSMAGLCFRPAEHVPMQEEEVVGWGVF